MEKIADKIKKPINTMGSSRGKISRSQWKKLASCIFIFLWGFLAAAMPTLFSMDPGYKFIRNYSDLEYNHSPQNWEMVQAKNGILYFANQAGVLEYDGKSWRIHYIPGHAVRSLAIDEQGTVFVGGGNSEIWYLAPDSGGTLAFVSLVNHLDEKYKNFGEVYSTHTLKNKVYFRTSNYLFIWDYEKMTTLKTTGIFKAAFIYNEELIIQDGEKGLLRVEGNTLQPVPGGKLPNDLRIAMFTPFGDRTVLVGTRTPEFFLFKDGKLTPFPVEAIDHIKQYKLNHGTLLSSGEFALATGKGLVIIDSDGKLKTIIDKSYGLRDDYIKYVFQDIWGNIWLCLEMGISKIEYNSPFSFFENYSTLSGLVMSATIYKDILYVGTRTGMYRLDKNSKFQQIPDFTYSCNFLLSTGRFLLAATDKGVFQFDETKPSKIYNKNSLCLLNSRIFPGITWCGTNDGFIAALENRSNQWREIPIANKLQSNVQSIAEGSEGDLWLGTGGDTVFCIKFPKGINQPEITSFNSGQGLLGVESYVAEIEGRIVVGTSKGLFKFDSKSNRFVPNMIFGKNFAGGENSKPVFRIAQGWDGQTWFSSESRNFIAVHEQGRLLKIIDKPFRRMSLKQVNAIYPDPAQKITWFAMNDGLYGFDTKVKKEYDRPFKTLIRKIILNESSENPFPIFNGYPGNTPGSDSPSVPQIPFENRNIYFEYTAPFFEGEADTQFQCFLVGYDSNWTTWSDQSNRNYTNLDPGLYRFRVRAKNVFGTIGSEAEYRFRVLLPWYRKWWMYLLYLILLIFSLYFVVQLRSRKLFREKMQLEEIVKERTKEIDEKNRQLERQTLTLQNQSEKLKELDKVKSRFFANISHEFRTPLTLILGPLEQMYSGSEKIEERKKIGTMLRNSQRLLNLINQLLDLSRLDSGKEKLHAVNREIIPFVKGIIANFETAAEYKKINLALHAPSEAISFYFDSEKMEKVMTNLLMNAVKYTPPHGNITVSVFLSGREPERNSGDDFVNISVKDTGEGIPPDQISYIFDRFFQAERLKTGSIEGTGIGLALVKEYVELHNGKIDVHSLEGQGTEFVLRFPTGSDHLQAGQITASAESVPPASRQYGFVESAFEIEETIEIETGESQAAVQPDDLQSQKIVILVVEDNTDMRRYICEPLKADYSVIEAVNGEEGIEKARKFIPDLIISDIMMPGRDGYDLCSTLKKDIITSHIPVILLTARASEESIIQGLKTGADDYITKPFNSQILLARIENLVELRLQLQLKIQKQMLLQPDEIKVSSMDQEFIRDLKKLIRTHLSESEFGVEALSGYMYMDRTTLYRKIKALTGEPPQIFIRSYRLQVAAKLLKAQAGNVSQIASQVGFDNMAYFAKCFKEKYKMLPSTFIIADHDDH